MEERATTKRTCWDTRNKQQSVTVHRKTLSSSRQLTLVGTFVDPYPFLGNMTRMLPVQFRILSRSSMPNFACLGGQLNYDVFYIQSNRPIVRRRWRRRMRYGKCIPVFYGRGMSKKKKMKSNDSNEYNDRRWNETTQFREFWCGVVFMTKGRISKQRSRIVTTTPSPPPSKRPAALKIW